MTIVAYKDPVYGKNPEITPNGFYLVIQQLYLIKPQFQKIEKMLKMLEKRNKMKMVGRFSSFWAARSLKAKREDSEDHCTL